MTDIERSVTAQSVRRQLALGGFLPIPVMYRGKAVLMKGWQSYRHDPNTTLPTHFLSRLHSATGVRCEGLCVIDIDIVEPAMAATVRAMFEEDLGETDFVRYRDRSSKVALFYRQADSFGATDEPVRLRVAGGQKVELYCHGGMQVIVHGEHADSTDAQPIHYRWERDPLWEARVSQLPAVSAAAVREAVTRVVTAYPPPDGAEASLSGARRPPAEAVRQILSAEDFHEATVSLAGVMAREGMLPAVIREYIHYVYSAVPVGAMTAERRKDWEVRRRDIDRCIADVCRREARARDSVYRQCLKITQQDPLGWVRIKGDQ